VAVHAGQYRRLPAPYPVPFWLQRVSLLRWFAFTMAHYTFAYAAHRCLLDGIPGVRLPGSAVYPRFRPLRTRRRPGGYAVTPAPGGRDLHPHGKLSYTAFGCAVCPRTSVLFRPTGRTSSSAVYSPLETQPEQRIEATPSRSRMLRGTPEVLMVRSPCWGGTADAAPAPAAPA